MAARAVGWGANPNLETTIEHLSANGRTAEALAKIRCEQKCLNTRRGRRNSWHSIISVRTLRTLGIHAPVHQPARANTHLAAVANQAPLSLFCGVFAGRGWSSRR